MSREVTQQQLEKFREALSLFPKKAPEKVHPQLHQACRDSIVSMIDDLEQQLREEEASDQSTTLAQ